MFKKRRDIRTLGGGNVGSLNVMHRVGVWPAVIVGLFDVGKGIASILVGKAFGVGELWLLGTVFSAVVGHCYPLYIGFRGGRGVATTVGIFLVLSQIVAGVACAIIGLLVLATRNVFLSVVACSPFFLAGLWLVNKSPGLMFLAAALIIFYGGEEPPGVQRDHFKRIYRIQPQKERLNRNSRTFRLYSEKTWRYRP
jgi:acyl phosphate:glycerol-3-phosphate acyltransferase